MSLKHLIFLLFILSFGLQAGTRTMVLTHDPVGVLTQLPKWVRSFSSSELPKKVLTWIGFTASVSVANKLRTTSDEVITISADNRNRLDSGEPEASLSKRLKKYNKERHEQLEKAEGRLNKEELAELAQLTALSKELEMLPGYSSDSTKSSVEVKQLPKDTKTPGMLLAPPKPDQQQGGAAEYAPNQVQQSGEPHEDMCEDTDLHEDLGSFHLQRVIWGCLVSAVKYIKSFRVDPGLVNKILGDHATQKDMETMKGILYEMPLDERDEFASHIQTLIGNREVSASYLSQLADWIRGIPRENRAEFIQQIMDLIGPEGSVEDLFLLVYRLSGIPREGRAELIQKIKAKIEAIIRHTSEYTKTPGILLAPSKPNQQQGGGGAAAQAAQNNEQAQFERLPLEPIQRQVPVSAPAPVSTSEEITILIRIPGEEKDIELKINPRDVTHEDLRNLLAQQPYGFLKNSFEFSFGGAQILYGRPLAEFGMKEDRSILTTIRRASRHVAAAATGPQQQKAGGGAAAEYAPNQVQQSREPHEDMCKATDSKEFASHMLTLIGNLEADTDALSTLASLLSKIPREDRAEFIQQIRHLIGNLEADIGDLNTLARWLSKIRREDRAKFIKQIRDLIGKRERSAGDLGAFACSLSGISREDRAEFIQQMMDLIGNREGSARDLYRLVDWIRMIQREDRAEFIWQIRNLIGNLNGSVRDLYQLVYQLSGIPRENRAEFIRQTRDLIGNREGSAMDLYQLAQASASKKYRLGNL